MNSLDRLAQALDEYEGVMIKQEQALREAIAETEHHLRELTEIIEGDYDGDLD